MSKNKGLTVHGFNNPALCALAVIRSCGFSVDERAWKKLIEKTPNSDTKILANGFVVGSLEDVQQLCDKGDFVIYSTRTGKLAACTRKEWIAKEKAQKE